jgi:hypothetical protein
MVYKRPTIANDRSPPPLVSILVTINARRADAALFPVPVGSNHPTMAISVKARATY